MNKTASGNYAANRRARSDISVFDPDYAILSELVPQLRELARGGPATILDFGSGNAPYKHLFRNSTYVAADVAQNSAGEIDLILDGLPLPFEDESVDLVLCIYVLEHIQNYADILKEFHRILRKDGRLFIATPFIYREHEAPNDFHRPTVFSLASDLSMFGKAEMRKVGNGWFTLYTLANELHIKQGERPESSGIGRWFRAGFNRAILPILNLTIFTKPSHTEDTSYHTLFALATKVAPNLASKDSLKTMF